MPTYCPNSAFAHIGMPLRNVLSNTLYNTFYAQ